MIHIPQGLILCVATLSACEKELQQLCPMVRLNLQPKLAHNVIHLSLAEFCSPGAGLWLNIPDYDAPTQMVKPKERNERYVDAVLTIPKVRLQHAHLQLAHLLVSFKVAHGSNFLPLFNPFIEIPYDVLPATCSPGLLLLLCLQAFPECTTLFCRDLFSPCAA